MAVYTINTRPEVPVKKQMGKPPTPRSSGMRNTVLASVVGVLLIGGVAFGAYKLWPKRVPPPDGDLVSVIKFVGSEDFNNLSQEKQDEYSKAMFGSFGKMRELGDKLTDDERRRAFENAGEARERPIREKYFSLPTPQEREKFLDEQIDEQAKRMAEWQKRRESSTRPAGERRGPDQAKEGDKPKDGTNNDANRQRGRGFSGERMKDRIENKSAGQRAGSAEFRAAMFARMKERGISGPGGGRRGGPR